MIAAWFAGVPIGPGDTAVEDMNVLVPRGDEAGRIASIWWLMAILGLVVYVVVLVLGVLGIRRRRGGGADSESDAIADRRSRHLITWGGIVTPTAVVVLLTAVTAWGGVRSEAQGELTVEVEGRQYWWRVHYPDAGVTTANEIRIPVDTPVELLLTSGDVIHSLWVPQLAGKLDLVPGRTNRMVIEANTPGVYRGLCAEFCGVAHAHMRMVVVAEPPDVHARWLADQAEPAVEPTTTEAVRGRDVLLGSCAYCHEVRGTNATSDFGPDLTHLMSRIELGAGVLDNDPDNLADWIRSTQRHKPGNMMPNVTLDDDDLAALIAYLEQLE